MVMVDVQCPEYASREVMKYGRRANGEQRYRCNHLSGERRIFLRQYHNTGRLLEVKEQMVDLALHGRGIRDTARVLVVLYR